MVSFIGVVGNSFLAEMNTNGSEIELLKSGRERLKRLSTLHIASSRILRNYFLLNQITKIFYCFFHHILFSYNFLVYVIFFLLQYMMYCISFFSKKKLFKGPRVKQNTTFFIEKKIRTLFSSIV